MDNLSSILDAIAVPVLAVDKDCGLLAANTLLRKALPETATSDRFRGFLATTKGLKNLLRDAADTGKKKKAKVKIGDHKNYLVNAVPTRIGDDQTVVLATFEDRNLQKALKTMRQGFVANVSHEMRSPLTAISGIVETLQGPAIEDAEMRTRFLDMMAREVQRMTSLVSDLLSLSQAEARERKAPKGIVAPNGAIFQAIETVTPLVRKHGKKLTANIAEDLPVVAGRPDDITRLFINLLENAIFYSQDNGHVSVQAGVASPSNPLGKPAVFISVSDDGEGIAAEDIPKLTERFYRVDKSRSRHLGGTGLGLAIVKHILVRHRGRLVIESELGKGSCFTVFLPIKK